MSKSNANTHKAQAQNNSEIEVLYQRLGDKWYAFSVVDGEVLYGAVPDEATRAPEAKASKTHPITGRS